MLDELADSTPSWYSRPAARRWRHDEPPYGPEDFHRSMPGYRRTPLQEVPTLAEELGVGRAFVKDESSRLGLPAFKMLGASWATYLSITRHLAAEETPRDLDALRKLVRHSPEITLVTATDGNHGRAVARMAELVGVRARVFVPDVVSRPAIEHIRREGAEVTVMSATYDETVQKAAEDAETDVDAILVQDTAWSGYEEIPGWIVDGYSTLFREIETQLTEQDARPAGLVMVPTGVGSLLQAATVFYRSGDRTPASVVAVEPASAGCVTESLNHGEPISVRTGRTNMAGLNCGTPSTIAWPVLLGGVDASVCVEDAAAAGASADLDQLGISSGPCGGASLAGLRALLAASEASAPETQRRRSLLGLTSDSSVVLLNTEGSHPEA